MNLDFFNGLLVVAYLLGGTVAIVLLAGWALKRFGSRKNEIQKPDE